MRRDNLVSACEIFAQTRHEDDGIVPDQISARLEDQPVDDIFVIVLEFRGGELRFKPDAFLANHLENILPRLEAEQDGGFRVSFVAELATDANGQVQRWNGDIAMHVDRVYAGGKLSSRILVQNE